MKIILLIFSYSHDHYGVFFASLSFLSVLLSLPVYPALADDQNPASTAFNVQNTMTIDIAGQVNPEGVRLKTGGFRRWIQDRDEYGEPSRYLQAGLGLSVSPAYATASVYGEWQPAVFLNLYIGYDLIRYLGVYTGLLSFPDKYSKFGDDELDRLEGREETATGQKAFFRPTLYAKAGPVIIMNRTDLSYFRFNGRGPYFMEIEYDTLLKDGDYVFDNSTSFFVPIIKGEGASVMYLGPYYNITRAHDSGLTRQRTGAQMYWVIADSRWGLIRPRLYSQATYYIEDRNRRGEISFAAGFTASFDL